MENTMIKGKIAVVFSILLLLSGSFLSKKAMAEEIVITGNGSETANEVVTTSSNETNITSSNTTTIENNVQVDANTGGNSVSDNTNGDTTVVTGNVSSTTNIENSGNVSQVSANNCCSEKGTVTFISGNGTGSKNTVTNSQNNATTITSYNNATITNTIVGNANTGYNTASGNNGDVYVKTGSISVNNKIKNAPVNLTWIDAALGNTSKAKFTILGNGAFSDNVINYDNNNETTVDVVNIADLINDVVWNLNTGHNKADDNNGDVTLITGDIDVETEITNAVNQSKVVIDCDCKEKPQPTPVPATPVEKVTTNAPSTSSSPSHHEVAGIAMEKVLPVTGTNWLFLAFIGNVMMLFLGMILRLRSGNSPGAPVVA